MSEFEAERRLNRQIMFSLAGDIAEELVRQERPEIGQAGLISWHEAGHCVARIAFGKTPWSIQVVCHDGKIDGACIPDPASPSGPSDEEQISEIVDGLDACAPGGAPDVAALRAATRSILLSRWGLVRAIANSLHSRCGGRGNWAAKVCEGDIRLIAQQFEGAELCDL